MTGEWASVSWLATYDGPPVSLGIYSGRGVLDAMRSIAALGVLSIRVSTGRVGESECCTWEYHRREQASSEAA